MNPQRVSSLLALGVLLVAVVVPAVRGKDKENSWTLEAKFGTPKIVKMNVPGRGERTLLYVEYEITNTTDEPRRVIPFLSLVSDKDEKEIPDEVIPSVQEKVRAGLENSVTASKTAVKPGETRRVIAIWDGVDAQANQFTIYLRGISNSVVVENQTQKYKSLQTRFERAAKGQEIRANGAAEWRYRPAR